jgi:hypothetical protein
MMASYTYKILNILLVNWVDFTFLLRIVLKMSNMVQSRSFLFNVYAFKIKGEI